MMPAEEEKLRRQVGELIRERRKDRGMLGRDIAERVGVTQSQHSRFESGKNGVTVVRLYQYAQALGCDPRDLLPMGGR